MYELIPTTPLSISNMLSSSNGDSAPYAELQPFPNHTLRISSTVHHFFLIVPLLGRPFMVNLFYRSKIMRMLPTTANSPACIPELNSFPAPSTIITQNVCLTVPKNLFGPASYSVTELHLQSVPNPLRIMCADHPSICRFGIL